MHQPVILDTMEAGEDRRRFARILKDELQRTGAHNQVPGSLGHHLALQAAWGHAERRARGGL